MQLKPAFLEGESPNLSIYSVYTLYIYCVYIIK